MHSKAKSMQMGQTDPTQKACPHRAPYGANNKVDKILCSLEEASGHQNLVARGNVLFEQKCVLLKV